MGAAGHYVVEANISNWAVVVSATDDFATTDVDTSTNKVTVGIDVTTASLLIFSSTGALPLPLVHGVHYYAIRVDATHIKVATTPILAATGTVVDITTVGSGTHTVDVGEGSSTTARQETIDRAETLVEAATRDVFYSKTLSMILDGNGKDRLFLGIPQKILTVTKVESSGVEIPIDYITHDDDSIFLDPEMALTDLVEYHFRVKNESSLFPEGTGNIVVTGSCGHASCPPGVKEAVIILCQAENDPTLYHRYAPDYQSESIGDYSATRWHKYITGVVEADKQLVPFLRRRPTFGAA